MRFTNLASARLFSLMLLTVVILFQGCGAEENKGLSDQKPGPIFNPSADNPLAGVTLENESANMPKIKKALGADSKSK